MQAKEDEKNKDEPVNKRNNYEQRERGGNKFTINPFISNSRLIKSLPPSSYIVNPRQVLDITCQNKNGKFGIIFLTMKYHIQFPKYLENKLKDVLDEKGGKKEFDQGRLFTIVLIEQDSEDSGGVNEGLMPLEKLERDGVKQEKKKDIKKKENPELLRFPQVQMTILCLGKIHQTQIKLIPCFNIQETRLRLSDICTPNNFEE